jgi:ATP-dependent DNA ligase
MQCKPVTALPTDEKWTFEIKFIGYRYCHVKRGREIALFLRNGKVLNKRFPKGSQKRSPCSRATSFSMENLRRLHCKGAFLPASAKQPHLVASCFVLRFPIC